MRISGARDCPVSPDDELACLFYPTLTERIGSGPVRLTAPQPASAKPKPTHTRRRWLLALCVVFAVLAAVLFLMTVPFSPDLVLRNSDPEGMSKYAFGTEIRKEDVTAITFLDALDAAPENAQDVSETGNGKVLLWAEKGHLFIAGDGKVLFPADSRYLLGGGQVVDCYKNLKTVDFRGAVNTAGVQNMAHMFAGAGGLAAVDVDCFDTSQVMDMNGMFDGCRSLVSVDLSTFDTGNVKDMEKMFHSCVSLASLDLSGFDTGNVTTMKQMFRQCSALTSLEVSTFDTGNVRDMSYMFSDCSNLQSLDLSNFVAGKLNCCDHMFMGCSDLRYLNLKCFEIKDLSYYATKDMFRGCRPDLGVISDDHEIPKRYRSDLSFIYF